MTTGDENTPQFFPGIWQVRTPQMRWPPEVNAATVAVDARTPVGVRAEGMNVVTMSRRPSPFTSAMTGCEEMVPDWPATSKRTSSAPVAALEMWMRPSVPPLITSSRPSP